MSVCISLYMLAEYFVLTLAIIPLFLEQSLYEMSTGPCAESNDDGYYYTEDLNVEPTSDMYDLEATYGSWDE